VIPLIQEITGPKVRVIDPAPAVARQIVRRLEASDQFNPDPVRKPTRYLTTGDPMQLQKLLSELLRIHSAVTPLYWDDLKLAMQLSSKA